MNPICWPDFIWQVTGADVPREEVVLLAAMINAQRLLSIDKLTVSRQELQRRYAEYTGLNTGEASIAKIIDELEAVEVPMLDGREKSDVHFIHE